MIREPPRKAMMGEMKMPTGKDFLWAIKETKELLLLIDKGNGVPVIQEMARDGLVAPVIGLGEGTIVWLIIVTIVLGPIFWFLNLFER